MPRPTPRLAPVTTATRPRRSGACQVMAPSAGRVSGAARPAPARSGTPTRPACDAPGGREPQLARRAESVGMVGPERGARLVEIERTEEIALEIAVLARNLLRGSPNLRHALHDLLATTPRQPDGEDPTTAADGLQRGTPQMPQNSHRLEELPQIAGFSPAAPGKIPHLPYVLGPPDACAAPAQMNVLVTGATGAIGADLVPRLAAAGHRVRAFARDPARVADPAVSEVVRGDAVAGIGLGRGARRHRRRVLPHPLDGDRRRRTPWATGLRGPRPARGGAVRRRRDAPRACGASSTSAASCPRGAAVGAPREPPRGRGDAARRRARGRRAARVDRHRRAVAVVPLPRAPRRARAGHGPAGLAREPHRADRRARRDRLPRRGRDGSRRRRPAVARHRGPGGHDATRR